MLMRSQLYPGLVAACAALCFSCFQAVAEFRVQSLEGSPDGLRVEFRTAESPGTTASSPESGPIPKTVWIALPPGSAPTIRRDGFEGHLVPELSDDSPQTGTTVGELVLDIPWESVPIDGWEAGTPTWMRDQLVCSADRLVVVEA